VVTLTRPRAYFGVPRDRNALVGASPLDDVPSSAAGVSSATLKVTDAAGRAVAAECSGERIVGRARPTAGNLVVLLELTQ